MGAAWRPPLPRPSLLASPALYLGRRYFASGSSSRLASFISLLAMTGLVMGVAMLIIVLSVMNGFDREMRERILAVVPHVQLFDRGGIADWQRLAARIGERPGVVEATPFTGFQGMINARGRIQAVTVQGLLPEALDSTMARVLPAETGQWLAAGGAGNGLVLSRSLADKLGVEPGHRLTLIVPRVGEGGRQLAPVVKVFSLAGIFDTHTAEDVGLALVHLDTAGALTGLGDRPQGLRVSLTDVFAAREFGYGLLRELPGTFTFMDWFQTHGNLHQAIQMSRQMVGLLILLIVAIAVFNVVSMLIMTVVDKRPAIATLKTLGADNGTILGIFFVQGSLIGLAGVGAGLVLGVLGALYVPDLVAGLEALFGLRFLNTEIYPIDYLPSQLRVADVVTVAVTALVLNFLATLYPAWKAARVRPADILRYE